MNKRSVQPPRQRPGGRRPAAARRPLSGQKPPVAPKRPRYWLRRLVALLIVLALLALVVWLAVLAFQGVKNYLVAKEQAENARKVSAQDVVIDPMPCALSDLDLKLQAVPATTIEGEGIKFEGVVTNVGKNPCYTDSGTPLAYWVITSGDDLVANLKTCDSKAGPRILLDKGYEWKVQWSWGGKHLGADCKGQQVAKAGTYKIQPKLLGQDKGDQVVFQVNPAPVVEPDQAEESEE